MKIVQTLMVGVLTLTMLSACSLFNSDATEAGDTANGGDAAATAGYNDADAGITGTEIQGTGRGISALGPEFSDPNNPLSQLTVYFMYDSAEVQQDFVPVIAAHAQYLMSHPGQRITLEGHGDERGSREYNIALGEKRAKAVSRMLKMQGVSAMQINEVSYGEEKPASTGHDEAAWQLNRRVEIAY